MHYLAKGVITHIHGSMPLGGGAHGKVVVLTESNEGQLPKCSDVEGLKELCMAQVIIDEPLGTIGSHLSLVGGTVAIQPECARIRLLLILDRKSQTSTDRDLCTQESGLHAYIRRVDLLPEPQQFHCRHRS